MIWPRFIVAILFIISQVDWGYTKLLFIQTMFRHGDRAPLVHYPWDITAPEFWPEGYAMLSKLGKKQNYALGKYLRFLYKDFVTSNPNEVLVNSTNLDRCILSALSQMASFYAPDPKWAFDDNLDWQPIPIHHAPYFKDKYLSLESDCPRFFEEMERIDKSPEYLQLTAKYKPMVVELSLYIDSLRLSGNIEILKFYDALSVNKIYNFSLPFWTESYFNQITEYCEITSFHAWSNPVIVRLRAGPILGKIVDDMKKKIAGDIPNLKVQAYSTNSHILIPVMNALGVFNNRIPPYCATLIFELHEMTNGTEAVRLLYLNSTTPEYGFQVPHVLTLDGCFEYCPLEYFSKYAKKSVPQDWERECGLT